MTFFKPFILFILCYFGVSIASFSQNNASVFTKKYSPQQLKQDAEILKTVTLAMHPGIAIYKPKTYYENLFNTFIGSLKDSLTQKEFCLKSKLLIGELMCGHTNVSYSKAYLKAMDKNKNNFSPYIFLPAQNKVYVLTNLNKKQDSTVKKGTEVLKINGFAVDSMLRYSRRFMTRDGYNETSQNHFIQLAFNSYYLSLFGRPDTFKLEYKDGNAIKKINYPAFKTQKIPSIPVWKNDDSLFTNYKKAKIKFRFVDSLHKTMVMKISAFSTRKSKKAYRKIFKKLNNEKTENLVIDLRNNGGGSMRNAYRLLSYLIDTTETQTLKTTIKSYPLKKYTGGNMFFKLTRFAFKSFGKHAVLNDTDFYTFSIKPNTKNHYKNKVFVLINGGTFSASSLVSAYLKAENRAVFIGEETGGAIEGCNAGIMPNYELPNTKVRVRMPAFRVNNNVFPKITGHGIMPDYPIEYSIKDILPPKDLELEQCLKLIHK